MGGGCFPKGTKIATDHGDVAIETIKVGDTVLAFNDAGDLSLKQVTQTFKHAYDDVIDESPLVIIHYDEGTLTATANHYIRTPSKQSDETDQGFARADQLEPGDIIYYGYGGEIVITDVNKGGGYDFVYNFEVEDYHTYIADNIRVHNGGGGKDDASDASAEASREAIKLQKESFNYIKNLIAPYEQGGQKSFNATLDLLGLGTGSQEEAINALTEQPYFQGLVKQGEQALLQNASATGGLRGGNTQAALAQFRPSMIQQLVQQQLGNLGGITATGMQGVSALSGASQNAANTMSNIAMQNGQTQASIAASQPSFLGQALGIAGVAGGLGWSPFG